MLKLGTEREEANSQDLSVLKGPFRVSDLSRIDLI